MATRTGKEPMFTAGKVAKELGIPASNVKKLILTHLSRRYVDAGPLLKEAKKVFPKSAVAEDFLRITLKRSK